MDLAVTYRRRPPMAIAEPKRYDLRSSGQVDRFESEEPVNTAAQEHRPGRKAKQAPVETTEAQTVRSVQRALEILSLLTEEQPLVTVRQIVDATGLAKTTVIRLVHTLEQNGLLWATENGYMAGPGLWRWAHLARSSWELPPETRRLMRDLAARHRETVNIYVVRDLYRVCVAQQEGPQTLRQVVHVGDELPLWGGAVSKVLLRDAPESLLLRAARSSPYRLRRGRADLRPFRRGARRAVVRRPDRALHRRVHRADGRQPAGGRAAHVRQGVRPAAQPVSLRIGGGHRIAARRPPGPEQRGRRARRKEEAHAGTAAHGHPGARSDQCARGTVLQLPADVVRRRGRQGRAARTRRRRPAPRPGPRAEPRGARRLLPRAERRQAVDRARPQGPRRPLHLRGASPGSARPAR